MHNTVVNWKLGATAPTTKRKANIQSTTRATMSSLDEDLFLKRVKEKTCLSSHLGKKNLFIGLWAAWKERRRHCIASSLVCLYINRRWERKQFIELCVSVAFCLVHDKRMKDKHTDTCFHTYTLESSNRL